VWPLGVVVAGEGIEEGLEGGEGGGLRVLGGQPVLEVCWNRSALPWVCGWFGRPFFWVIPRWRSSCSKLLRPPLPPDSRVVKTIPLSVSVEAGGP